MAGDTSVGCRAVLGDAVSEAVVRARKFLEDNDTAELLDLVGQTVPELALGRQEAKWLRMRLVFPGGGGRL